MGTEIERKFLVQNGLDLDSLSTSHSKIQQGYVNQSAVTVRVDRVDGTGHIILRDLSETASMHVRQYGIPLSDAAEIQDYHAQGSLVVRVRQLDDKGFLTMKGPSVGASCPEWEYEIPLSHAIEMLEKYTAGSTLSKTRYRIPAGAHEFEVDVFHGKLEGLVVAEVELRSENDVVVLPEWIRAEVTSDFRYKNTSLIAATESAISELLGPQ